VQIFEDGTAFPLVHDLALRLRIQQAVLDFPRVIPSLRIFLENTKYLRVMTDVIKRVLPPRYKGTIRQAMLRYYIHPKNSEFEIQVSVNDFAKQTASKEYGFWSAYRQLFLFAMRHFFGLTNSRPLGLKNLSCPSQFDRSELWRQFGILATKVGFAIPALKNARSGSTTEFVAIRTLLTRLRPPELFSYEESTINECSSQLASILGKMSPRSITSVTPVQSWDKVEDWSLEERCGMTNTQTFFSDQRYLFLHNIYSNDEPARENMTSFAVKRDLFKSFFPEFGEDQDMEQVPEEGNCTSDELRQGMTISPNFAEQSANHDLSQGPQAFVPEPTITQPYSQTQVICTNVPEAIMSQPHSQTQVTRRCDVPEATIPQPSVQIQPIQSDVENQYIEPDIASLEWQSPEACCFKIHINADNFYASYKPYLESLDGVLFFDVTTKEVFCLRRAGFHQLPDLIKEIEKRWFAKVDDTLILKTLNANEAFTQCERGKCIIFHGTTKFKSCLEPDATTKAIVLPSFDPAANKWSLLKTKL
jgi:hypothetical protein